MCANTTHETTEQDPLMITDLPAVAGELTDDDLAQVAGGTYRVIDIKCYDDNGKCVDWEIYILP